MLLTVSGQLDPPCRREFKDKLPSQWLASQESARPHPSREVRGVEKCWKAAVCRPLSCTSLAFRVENDDDVRDAVVADIVDEMEKGHD